MNDESEKESVRKAALKYLEDVEKENADVPSLIKRLRMICEINEAEFDDEHSPA